MFRADCASAACVSGTTFGREVVPEVVSTSATSPGALGGCERSLPLTWSAAPSGSSVNWPAGPSVPAVS